MNLYVLTKPESSSPEDELAGIDITLAEDTETGECEKCPNCGWPSTKREWLSPFRVELETWGENYGDLSRVSDGIVVSERFATLYAASSLRGLSNIQPVQVVKVIHRQKKIKGKVPGYFKATICRSPTTVDQEASGYEWEDKSARCSVCLRGGTVKRYARVVVDESTWNGDDIFWPRGGPCILVSVRFKSWCEENGFRGLSFGELEDESYDFYPWETRAAKQAARSAQQGESAPPT